MSKWSYKKSKQNFGCGYLGYRSHFPPLVAMLDSDILRLIRKWLLVFAMKAEVAKDDVKFDGLFVTFRVREADWKANHLKVGDLVELDVKKIKG